MNKQKNADIVAEQPPLPQVQESRAEFRRESCRIQPGERLLLVMPDGTVAPLELSVIRRGRTPQVCDAGLYDINDGGLALATSVRLPEGERIMLCATCETETEPLFSEDLVVLSCRRKYDSGRAVFVSGFEFSKSPVSRLYKAALDSIFLNRAGLASPAGQLAESLRQ